MLDRIRSVGATARFLLNPDAHDRQTIATLRSLFDTVMTADDSLSEWTPATTPVPSTANAVLDLELQTPGIFAWT